MHAVLMSQSKYFTRQKLRECTFTTKSVKKRQGEDVESGSANLKTHVAPKRKKQMVDNNHSSYEQILKVKTHGKSTVQESSTTKTKEPSIWKEQLANIKEMRRHRDAPVDSMGCDVISDKQASPEVN